MNTTSIKEELSILYDQLDTDRIYEDPVNYFVHGSGDLLVLGIFEAKHRVPGFYVIIQSDDWGCFEGLLELVGWCLDEMDCEGKICHDTDMDSYDIRIFYNPHHLSEDYPKVIEALKLLKIPEPNIEHDENLIAGFIVTPLDYHS